MTASLIEAAAIGFVAGYLSGQFGIGGGIVTTPAIHLLLGYPELIAVGTPLPVIVPTAIVGAVSYVRRGLADVRTGLVVGVLAGAFAVPAAWVATRVGGDVVLLATSALIGWMAVDMAMLALRPAPPATEVEARSARARSWGWLGLLGAGTGLYSGFLGLGGGFVIVPVLVRFFGFDAKRAVGTSLVALPILAIPGSIAHHALGNVDVPLALALMVGVVPGALLGAKVTALARERTIRLAFAGLLVLVAAVLAASQLGSL